ncbi:2417_t:CDS:2 [Ambispora leptoticha]|uniref:2417_t:CDS:1 n=1 Tax=Ambispora leptoticha TaxID=144679 RepID=A0A9N8Z4N8_9GLOM|nr:2417_t:CDS:2 [Ambispora leptoticha]
MSNPNDCIGDYKVLVSYPNHPEALTLLKRIASSVLIVKPIMKKYGWRVGILKEFFPEDPCLLGLNVNHGEEIRIRLRVAHDNRRFCEFDDLIGTMLHELTHIVRGPHDAEFYKILDNLNNEYDELLKRGYTGEGFFTVGHRLGGASNVPIEVARKRALEASEKRRLKDQVMMKGGQKLGGGNLWSGLSVWEKAALAAERRMMDNVWCGNEGYSNSGSRKNNKTPTARSKAEKSHPNVIPRLALNPPLIPPESSAAEDWAEWTCISCTLVNKPLVLQCEVCNTKRHIDVTNSGPNTRNISSVVNTNQDFIVAMDKHAEIRKSTWSCKRCTFENAHDVIMCLACDYLLEDRIS